MDYELFKTDDFIVDESFQGFHFKGNTEDVIFWEDWIKEHPGKLPEITRAREFLSLMSVTYQNGLSDLLEEDYKKIRHVLAGNSSEKSPGKMYIPGNKVWDIGKRLSKLFLLLALLAIAHILWHQGN